MSLDNEPSSESASNKEELKYIFQAALAPLTIAKRVFVDGTPIWSAIKQTIVRDNYIKMLHEKQNRSASSNKP
jgi:hypothetical protein